jgi:clan AA aspartic protease (TIGR02281 family)
MFDDLIPTQPPGAFSVPFMSGGREGVHTVSVALASTELAMEIDTGSDTIAISPGLARRLVERGEAALDGTTTVAMANGATATANLLIIHRLAIGGHVLTDVEASDGGGDMPLLGMSALGRFGKVSLDLANHRLKLE